MHLNPYPSASPLLMAEDRLLDVRTGEDDAPLSAVVRIAAALVEAPMACVSQRDGTGYRICCGIGIADGEGSIHEPLWDRTLAAESPVVEASLAEGAAPREGLAGGKSPLLPDAEPVAFYVGLPVRTPRDGPDGVLSLFGPTPRHPDRATLDRLKDLTRLAVPHLSGASSPASPHQAPARANPFKDLFNSLSIPVVHGVPDGERFRVVAANPAFEALFEVGSSGQMALSDLIGSGDPYDEAAVLDEHAPHDSPHRTKVRRPTADGPRTFEVHVTAQARAGGETDVYAVYVDITNRKQYEDELAYHTRLEGQIVDISTRFISAPVEDLDQAIERSLGAVGEVVEADRSYVFLVDAEQETVSNTHEWCAEGIASHQPDLQNIPYGALSWFMEKMHRFEVMASSAAALPLEADALYNTLVDGNIQSLVVLPMVRDDTLVGFVGFDAVRRPREWSDETVTILRVLGDAITGALERKQMETELRDAKAQAEEAARLKSAMLANMSHEIRTPLTTITGFSELLVSELEGEAARLVEMVHDNSERLQETLTSVLQLSKLEADGMALDETHVEVTKTVGEVVQVLQPDAHSAGVEVRTDLEAGVGWMGDEQALRRIVTNLTENAIKFTPSGGVVVVRGRADASAVTVGVEDTGVGIDEAFLPNLFNAFEQEHGGLDREHEGSGLGLAITKRLVEALEGRIEVESEKGVGTRFRVELPQSGDA